MIDPNHLYELEAYGKNLEKVLTHAYSIGEALVILKLEGQWPYAAIRHQKLPSWIVTYPETKVLAQLSLR